MRRPRVWAWVVVVIFGLLFTAACSSSDDTTDGDAPDGDTDGDVPDGDADGDGDADTDGDAPDYTAALSEALDVPIDETIAIAGLTDGVAVAYDAFGVPHVYAKNEHDAMRVIGWVQASERMVEMEFLRKLSRGQLTELIIDLDPLIDADLWYRSVFATKSGEDLFTAIYEQMDEDMKAAMSAYLEGVNARLAQYRAHPEDWPVPFSYLLVNYTPENARDWTPQDVLAIGRYQSWSLASTLGLETGLTELYQKLGAELYGQLISAEPTMKVSILDHAASFKRAVAGQSIQLPKGDFSRMLAGLNKRLESVRKLDVFKQRGASNNWVVAADNTGVAYLANDPHLSLQQPAVFMPMTVDLSYLSGEASSLHAGGIAFPGTPAFIIGRTRHVGWALTTTYLDVLDVYLEEVTFNTEGEPVSVTFNGAQVDVVKVMQQLRQGHGEPESYIERPLYFVPHHGPLMADTFDTENGTALSLRWTGLEPSQEVQTVYRLSKVNDVDTMFELLKDFDVGAQNYVFADTNGDIGYFPHGLVPIRSGDLSAHPPWMIMPGDGSVEWDGYIPEVDYPKLKNPESGMIVTANNDITGSTLDGNPLNEDYYTQWYASDAYRAYTIKKGLQDLKANGGWDWETHRDLQFTYRSDFAEILVTAILGLVERYNLGDTLDADSLAALAMLENWNYEALSGLGSLDPAGALSGDSAVVAKSAAANYFYHLFVRLGHDMLGDELAAADVSGLPWALDERAVIRLILALYNDEVESPLWDNIATEGTTETAADILAAAIPAAIDDVLAHDEYDGLSLDQAAFGRIHTLTLAHPLSLLTDSYSEGPYALGGGPYTVNVANFGPGLNPGSQSYTFGSGPSVRFVHEVGPDGIKTHYNLPGGVSGRADSEHYHDLFELWTTGEMTDLIIAWDKLKGASLEKVTAFVPAP